VIRTCGGQPVAPARAEMMLDLWLMSVGPFLEAFGAAIFQGNIHRTFLFELFSNSYGNDFELLQVNIYLPETELTLEAHRAVIPRELEIRVVFSAFDFIFMSLALDFMSL
jgi:hypothetical protein